MITVYQVMVIVMNFWLSCIKWSKKTHTFKTFLIKKIPLIPQPQTIEGISHTQHVNIHAECNLNSYF